MARSSLALGFARCGRTTRSLALLVVATTSAIGDAASDVPPPRVRQVLEVDVPVVPPQFGIAPTRLGVDAAGNAVVVSGSTWQRVAIAGAKSSVVAIPAFDDVAFLPDGTAYLAGASVARIDPDGTVGATAGIDPSLPDGWTDGETAVAARASAVRVVFLRSRPFTDTAHGRFVESRVFVQSLSSDLVPQGAPVDVTPSVGPSPRVVAGMPRVGIGRDGVSAVVVEAEPSDPAGEPMICTNEDCATGPWPFTAFIGSAGDLVAPPRAFRGFSASRTTTTAFLDDGSTWVAHAGDGDWFSAFPGVGVARFAAVDSPRWSAAGPLAFDRGDPNDAFQPIDLAADSDGAVCTVEECLACPPMRPSVVWRRTTLDGAKTIVRRLPARHWTAGVALAVAPDGTSLVAATEKDASGRSRIVAVALDRRGRVTRRLLVTWAWDVGPPILAAARFGGPVRFALLWSERAAPAAQGSEPRSFLAFVE